MNITRRSDLWFSVSPQYTKEKRELKGCKPGAIRKRRLPPSLYFFLFASVSPRNWWLALTSIPRKNVNSQKRLFRKWRRLGEIWKQLYYMAWGLPSTIIHDENRALWKPSSNQRNLKISALICRQFYCGQETFWKQLAFENDNIVIVMWFPCPSFPQTQI